VKKGVAQQTIRTADVAIGSRKHCLAEAGNVALCHMKPDTKPTAFPETPEPGPCRKCTLCQCKEVHAAERETKTEIRALYDAEAQSYYFFFSRAEKN